MMTNEHVPFQDGNFRLGKAGLTSNDYIRQRIGRGRRLGFWRVSEVVSQRSLSVCFVQ